MRQLWKLLAILAAFAVLAAACGGDDDDAGTAEPASEPAEADDGAEEPADADDGAEEPSGDRVALRWRTRPDNQAEADVYQAISDQIEANSNLDLTYEPGGSDTSAYQDVLKTELASGTAPDVFWIPGTDVADFVTRGLLLDMRSLADGSGHSDSDFYEGPMFHLTFNPDSGNTGEALWGLPRDVSAFAIYMNLDLISEAGAEDPRDLAAAGDWNWTTFREVASDIAAVSDETKGFGSDAWWGPWGYYVNAAGGSMFNDDRTACALDSDAALEGLTFANELWTSGDTINWGEGGEAPFQAGTLGMFMNGRWATPSIRSGADFNWDVVKLPDGPGGPSNWLFWGAYVVNADTADPEAAWQLVQELTSAETQASVSEAGANIPSRQGQEAIDAFLTFTPPANNQAFIDGLSEAPVAEGPIWAGSWPEFSSVASTRVNAVIAGEESIESFADTGCSEIDTAAFG